MTATRTTAGIGTASGIGTAIGIARSSTTPRGGRHEAATGPETGAGPDRGATRCGGGACGPIRTAAPWGSFGVGWDQINRWDQAIDRASAEFGVPAERIKAHIVIESGGPTRCDSKERSERLELRPDAGRPAVVETSSILRLAGRPDTGQGEREVGQLLLDDPDLAVRAGTGVLQSIFDGDWDRTSSKFFLGNPDWTGADTVNGNTGLQYKAMLEGADRRDHRRP